jgi:hypothetical protein
MSLGEWFPTFGRRTALSSSRVKQAKNILFDCLTTEYESTAILQNIRNH